EIDRDAVTDEADRGHDEDDVALHMRGLAEPAQSLDKHHRRDHEEKHRIEHGRQDLQAQAPERPAIGERTGPEPHRHKRVRERRPDGARVFARYGLSCASCSISKSETIMAGATGHGGGRVNVEDLMRDLNTYADSGKLPDNLPAANATAGAGGMKMRGMAEQKGIKHVIADRHGKA